MNYRLIITFICLQFVCTFNLLAAPVSDEDDYFKQKLSTAKLDAASKREMVLQIAQQIKSAKEECDQAREFVRASSDVTQEQRDTAVRLASRKVAGAKKTLVARKKTLDAALAKVRSLATSRDSVKAVYLRAKEAGNDNAEAIRIKLLSIAEQVTRAKEKLGEAKVLYSEANLCLERSNEDFAMAKRTPSQRVEFTQQDLRDLSGKRQLVKASYQAALDQVRFLKEYISCECTSSDLSNQKFLHLVDGNMSNGVLHVAAAQNTGCNPINVVCTDRDSKSAFAVLKQNTVESRQRVAKERLAYSLTCRLKIPCFARVLALDSDRNAEELVKLFPTSICFNKLPEMLRSLQGHVDDRGCLTLFHYNDRTQNDSQQDFPLAPFLDVESIHRYAIATMLLQAGDVEFRNMAFRIAMVAENPKLMIVGFDNEDILARKRYHKCPRIFIFPQAKQPLHPAVRNAIIAWQDDVLEPYQQKISSLCNGDVLYRNLVVRLNALYNFVVNFPNASPCDIFLYSFVGVSKLYYGYDLRCSGLDSSLVRDQFDHELFWGRPCDDLPYNGSVGIYFPDDNDADILIGGFVYYQDISRTQRSFKDYLLWLKDQVGKKVIIYKVNRVTGKYEIKSLLFPGFKHAKVFDLLK